MNKISYYALWLIIIIVTILIVNNNYNIKTKDKSGIEKDSCVCESNDTIDTFVIEEICNADSI